MRHGVKLRNKVVIGLLLLGVVAATIALLTERPPTAEQKQAAARLFAQSRKVQPETRRIIDNLIAAGMIKSADSPTDFYVDVVVEPRFYALDTDRKKAVIIPVYTYYLTERHKTESDIFAVRLIDGRTGKEVGAYQAGTLQMNK